MKYTDSHLSDERLLMSVEGELSRRDEKQVQAHLEACWKCRARGQELSDAIHDYTRMHEEELGTELADSAGPRALLRARLSQLSAEGAMQRPVWKTIARVFLVAIAAGGALVFGLFLTHSRAGRYSVRAHTGVFTIPDSRLTPGATVLVTRPSVCAQPNTKNKAVSAALQKQVFEEYGIAGADPRMYEVDYLVTPALGGADDIHNLWPHSYRSTLWNAQVKDALEDRLRDMVCDGEMDLAEAQQEIAGNWIAAYKKYFHTSTPLAEHLR